MDAEEKKAEKKEVRDAIPVLKGWLSLPDAAARLGTTRQRVFQMVDEKKWASIRKILGGPSGIPGQPNRPALLVVSEDEVNRMLAEQAAAMGETPEPQALAS